MTSSEPITRLDVQALAERGERRAGASPLQKMERLAHDLLRLEPDSVVRWQVETELRTGTEGGTVPWMHLNADAVLPLACQRCLGLVNVPVQIDLWYRFVASEELALAEDDESEEELLVLEPQFDLTALLEDELLLAIPVVPMHEICPVVPVMQAGDAAVAEAGAESQKPNPFAVLAKLKKTEK
jgi:uncharacterized protein